MAKRFTDLNELTTPASDDQLAIVDTSANETKRISLLNLLTDFIDAVHIKANAIITSKILDGAVTAAKIEPQQAWQTVGYLNGFSRYSTATDWGECQYYKDSLGMVHMKGLIKGGSVNASMFQLPVGYRPQHNIIITTHSSDALCRIDVLPDGHCIPRAGFNTAWISLNMIHFRAYQ